MKPSDALETLAGLLDKAIGLAFDGLETVGVLSPVSQTSYWAVHKALAAQMRLTNDLEVLGLENVPAEGGMILASNHQSWLDIGTLIASSPRRAHFVAKAEFKDFPFVRQGIRLSQSLYIERGGDKDALSLIADNIKAGKAVVIFPEGTIPGEEDIPRRDRDPETGLLEGRTGAVRLALRANVPIIPVGISGTERALPPEVWPRREILRLPTASPITVRFGEPITFHDHSIDNIDRAQLRKLTRQLMLRISDLVNHSANYTPIQVPAPEPAQHENVGVLLLHGFTSHTSAVSQLIPHLEKLEIPYGMPVLRGHGTRYQDLVGVTAKDWYVDAEHALIDLWNRVDKVIIVGFSMGGLVGLDLAMKHPEIVAGVVPVAASLKFADPMARFASKVAAAVKYFPSPDPYNDAECRAKSQNYKRFPVATFASLYDYSVEIKQRLGDLHIPIRILQSKKDRIVMPVSANIIYEKVSSPRREIIWYQDSGHEMLADSQSAQVCTDIVEFVQTLIKPSDA